MSDKKISFINFSNFFFSDVKEVEPKSKNNEQNLGLELKKADSVNELKFVDKIILPESDKYTTNAIGEEGGDMKTTLAMGEEGGDKILPDLGEQPKYTTLAMGEEGGSMVTTNAIGEEGGAGPLIPIEPFNIKPESLLEKLIKRMNGISFIPWYK